LLGFKFTKRIEGEQEQMKHHTEENGTKRVLDTRSRGSDVSLTSFPLSEQFFLSFSSDYIPEAKC